MNKYITIVSLREPVIEFVKPRTKVRGQRASAHIYDDMIDAYRYANEANIYHSVNMPQSEITVAIDTYEAIRNMGMAVQQASHAVQGLANMGQAAAISMRSINESLNAFHNQEHDISNPLDEIMNQIYTETLTSEMTTHDLIERLISEYENRGEI